MEQPDPAQTIFLKRPESLARMIALDSPAADLWSPEEMHALWRHQLSAPLEVDLSTVDSSRFSKLRGKPGLDTFLAGNFGLLLTDPQPPFELLILTKDFAKETLQACEDAQLKQAAAALYYAVYAAGMVRCNLRPGGMGDDELKRGFHWALDRPWLDEATRKLIGLAAESFAARP